jgi:hypothetical protein
MSLQVKKYRLLFSRVPEAIVYGVQLRSHELPAVTDWLESFGRHFSACVEGDYIILTSQDNDCNRSCTIFCKVGDVLMVDEQNRVIAVSQRDIKDEKLFQELDCEVTSNEERN